MATKKKWIWIIVTVLAVCVVALLAVAAFGVYFVASHIDTSRTTSADAFRQFDEAKAALKDQKPLYELDQRERPRVTRQLSEMPTAAARPEHLIVLAWDPDDERVVKVTLPFWLLRMGRRKIKIDSGSGFDLERLDLDVNELQRVGPLLLFDYRSTSGERVLVWTR
jgi:hypothetical protein